MRKLKLFKNIRFSDRRVVIGMAIFGLIGTILLIRSFAAVSGVISFEAEAGTKSGAVATQSDSTASNGQFVNFRPSGTTGQPTSIQIDSSGPGGVTLENSLMRVRYASYNQDDNNLAQGKNFAIIEWWDKATNRDLTKQVGGTGTDKMNAEWCYTSSHTDVPKWNMTSEMVRNETNVKSVRLRQDGCNSSEVVTIYANSPVLKIDLETFPDHLMDDRNSRAVPHPTVPNTMMPEPHDFVLYQNGPWRDYLCPENNTTWCEKEVYARQSFAGNSDPADGGALNYNGNLIFGYITRSTQAGFGRVMPISSTPWMTNQLNESSEMLLHNWAPMTTHLFMVRAGGANELLNLGKSVADGQIPTR